MLASGTDHVVATMKDCPRQQATTTDKTRKSADSGSVTAESVQGTQRHRVAEKIMQIASPEDYDTYVAAQVKHEMKLQSVRNELELVMEFMTAFEKIRPLDGPKKLEFERMVRDIQHRTLEQADDTIYRGE